MSRRSRRQRRWQSSIDTLIASGQLLSDNQRRVTTRSHETWQAEAWHYYRSIGELWAAAHFYAELVAVATLTVDVFEDEWVPGVDDDGVPVNDEAAVALEIIADLGDHTALLRSIGLADIIVGESFLVGTFGERDWRVRSTSELVPHGGEWHIRQNGAMVKLPPDTSVIRLWQPDPEHPSRAISPVRACLDICATITSMTDAIMAAGFASALNGLLRVPSTDELSPSPIGAVPETDDAHPLQQDLVDVASLAHDQPRTAARWVPMVLPIPSEMPDHALELIRLTHGLEDLPAEDLLEHAVRRLTRSLPLPPEIVLGHQETTFANARQIDITLVRRYAEPALQRLTADLTAGYLVPALEAASVPPGRVRMTYGLADAHPVDMPDLIRAAVALVRAGFEPQAALQTVGLPPIEHTGRIPAPEPSEDTNDAD